jgi:hypothetical protein
MLDQLLIILGPLVGKFGDGLRTMAFEPGDLQGTGGHAAGHDDLEGALAEDEFRWLGLVADRVAVTGVLVGDAVEGIAMPVEFLLQGDHLTE